MRQKLVWILLVLMVGSFVYLRVRSPNTEQSTVVKIGRTQVQVEIAATPEKRAQGLSGRVELADDHGMLFPMGEPQVYAFWMKAMRFPLDIIWIRDGRVVDISENVPAPTAGELPVSVRPREPIDYVLEVNAGFVEKKGIGVGDRVEIKF